LNNILITGGAGFIGSNFIKYLLSTYHEYKVINVDSLTYAGNLQNLSDISTHPHYFFIKADIGDKKMIEKVFSEYSIDIVVNFAAESHVDRSIDDPEIFLRTNVIGTQVLLDTAKKFWNIHPENKYSFDYKAGVKFIQISTDEVYGSLGNEGKFVESMPLQPNSPYSVSKASADLLVRAYYKTFGLPINITRCSNNYGPYQFPEKLIPLMINNCINNKSLPIYGDGMQIRDWLHVQDHCQAIDLVMHKGISSEIYNIGGNNEIANIDIVNQIIKYLGKDQKLIKYVKDRPGHDRRYAIDSSKIQKELGWQPQISFKYGMQRTIQWYIENKEWLNDILTGEYQKYYTKIYKPIL